MADQGWRSHRAWRGTTVAVLLHITGMPFDLMIARSVGAPMWPDASSILFGVVLLGILATRRHRPTVGFAQALFLVDVLAIVTAIWLTNPFYAESGRPWVPFQSNKLGMITVALLAPELWVGAISIAAYAGTAVVQLETFSSAALSRFALGEPWASLAIGFFAVMLLLYRLQRLKLERKVVRIQTEQESMATFAKTMLAIRDLANTPLQTITFASAIARIEHPEVAPILDRIDRSLATIKTVDDRLREYEQTLKWEPNEESFEAVARLSGSDPRKHVP